MIRSSKTGILAGCLYLLGASAVQAAMSTADAMDMAKSMAGQGKSDKEIVKYLIDDGRMVEQATAVVVASAESGDRRVNATKAGLCYARDGDEAEQVRSAAYAAAGDETLALEIRTALATFSRSSCTSIGVHILSPGLEKAAAAPSNASVSATSAGGGSNGADVSPSI